MNNPVCDAWIRVNTAWMITFDPDTILNLQLMCEQLNFYQHPAVEATREVKGGEGMVLATCDVCSQTYQHFNTPYNKSYYIYTIRILVI